MRRINAAYTMTPYAEAPRALRDVAQWLQGINETTAMSTNPLESALAGVRVPTRRAQRGRNDTMISRWVASALFLAQNRLRRVNGLRSMALLIEALKRQGASIAKEVG